MLQPFDFHYQVRDHFKRQLHTWKWFSDTRIETEQRKEMHAALLKNTYRLDPQSEPRIYALLTQALQTLGISLPVTVYQSQQSPIAGASVIMLDTEAHLLLVGPLLKLLSDQELLAVLAHEVAHISLYTTNAGDFEISSRIVDAIARDPRSTNAQLETARLFNLFVELYCDLGALAVTGDADVVIAALVKTDTGLETVSPETFLRQADEIISSHHKASAGETHPELFIRAKAVALFASEGNASLPKISQLVLGKPEVDALSMFDQPVVLDVTRQLIVRLLQPAWMRGGQHAVLARQYFAELNVAEPGAPAADLAARIADGLPGLADYYSYVLLDFALADTETAVPATGLASQLADDFGLRETLSRIIKKELALSEKRFDVYIREAQTALAALADSERNNAPS